MKKTKVKKKKKEIVVAKPNTKSNSTGVKTISSAELGEKFMQYFS
jgi:hypothetical protein